MEANRPVGENDETEDIAVCETYGGFIIKSMAGEYYIGALHANENSDNIVEAFVKDAVRTRNYYTYYLNVNKNEEVIQPAINADADYTSGFFTYNNWSFNRLHWQDVLNCYAKNGTYIGNAVTYTTWAWTREDSQNTYLYLVSSQMSMTPTSHSKNNTLYFESLTTQSNVYLAMYGPQKPPSSVTKTYSIGGLFNRERSISLTDLGMSTGYGIDFGFTYSYNEKDIILDHPNTNPAANTFTVEYTFDHKDFQEQWSTDQPFYAVFRSKTSTATTIFMYSKISVRFSKRYLTSPSLYDRYELREDRFYYPTSACDDRI